MATTSWIGILVSVAIVAAAVVMLCIRVIVKKNGRFSSQHISQSKAMRERGIGCATSQDRAARKDNPHKISVKDL